MKKLINIFLFLMVAKSYVFAQEVKINGNFSLSTGAVYGGYNWDMPYDIELDTITFGGPFVYVLGHTMPDSYYILKYNSAGVFVSSVSLPSYDMGEYKKLIVMPSNPPYVYVLGKYVDNINYKTIPIIIKYDSDLEFISNSNFDFPLSVDPKDGVSDSQYIYSLVEYDGSCSLIKIDTNLSVISGPLSVGSWCNEMKLKNGNLYVLASTESGKSIFKIPDNLSVIVSSYELTYNNINDISKISVSNSGNIFVLGYINAYNPATNRNDMNIKVYKFNSSLDFVSSTTYVSSNWGQLWDSNVDDNDNLCALATVDNGSNLDYGLFVFDELLNNKSAFFMDAGHNDTPYHLAIDNSSNVYVTGEMYVYEPYSYDWKSDISTVKFDLKTSKNNEPFLSWVSTENYWSDGLHPESGVLNQVFVYRIKYVDPDNDPPLFVKVHIYKDNNEIENSPFIMSRYAWNAGEDNYKAGAFYQYISTFAEAGNYSYQFEACDDNTPSLCAKGNPVFERKWGPQIGEGFIGNTALVDGSIFSNGYQLKPKGLTIFSDSSSGDYVWGLVNQGGTPFILKFSTGVNSIPISTPIFVNAWWSNGEEITNDEDGNLYILTNENYYNTSTFHKYDKNFTAHISSSMEMGIKGLKYFGGTLYSFSGNGIVECPVADLSCQVVSYNQSTIPPEIEGMDLDFGGMDYYNNKIYAIFNSTAGILIFSLSKDGSYGVENYTFFKPFESGNIEAKGISIDSSGNIFIGAQINNGQNNNFLILKYDSNLSLIKTAMYDAGGMEELEAIKVNVNTAAGDVYITGKADVKGNFYNVMQKLVVVNYNNNLEFKSNYIYGADWEYNKGVSIAVNSVGHPYVLGYTDSYNRKIRAMRLLLPSNTVNLDLFVKRKNDNGNLKDINVALIPFKDGKTDVSFIQSGLTDDSGKVSFNIPKHVSYLIALSTPNYVPTVRDQILDPYGNFYKVFTAIASLEYLLSPSVMPNNNTVKVKIGGLYKDVPVLAEIYLTRTGEKVAYGFLKATDTIDTIEIYNVPSLAGGTYGIDISIPGWLSVNLLPQTPIPSTYTFTASMANALPPSSNYVQTTSTSGVYFSGFVGSTDGNALKNARVEVYYDCQQSGCDFTQETYTDANGKFFFTGLTLPYETQLYAAIHRQGYKSLNIPLPVPLPALNMSYFLEPATYTLSGVIKYMGNPIAYSKIRISSDWKSYGAATDSYSGSYGANIGEVFVKTDGDGYFSITGLTDGNVILTVDEPVWRELNRGEDNISDTADDIRITISSDTAKRPFSLSSNPCIPGKVWVLNSSGTCKDVMPYVFDIGVLQTTNTYIYGDIVFVTTWSVSQSEPLTIDKSSAVVIGLFEKCRSGNCSDTKNFFKTIYGTLTSNTTSYSIDVSTTAEYWLEVLSNSWAKVFSFDDTVVFNSTEPIRRDLRLIASGKVVGYIKKPDGSIYNSDENGGWPEIYMIGENVSYHKGSSYFRNGMFEFYNLPPGKYTLKVRPRGQNNIYAPTEIKGLVVNAGKTLNVNVTLKEGLFVQPQIYGLPDEIIRSTQVWHYAVLAVPSGQPMNQKYITQLFFSEPSYAFDYSSTTLQWSKLVMPEGQYDFYLVLVSLYCTHGDERCNGMENYTQFAYFIGNSKNIGIKKDENNPLLGTEAQPIPINILGSLGQYEFGGWGKGSKVFTDADFERIFADFENEIMPLIPAVMVYDSAGVLKGFSHILPTESEFLNFENAIISQNKQAVRDIIETGGMQYYLWGMPPGKYTVVFANPNYPPITKNVTIPDESEYNFNFDEQNIIVGGFSGIVRSSTVPSIPLNGAIVYIKGKVSEKYLIADSSGIFNVNNLPSGVYKIEVSMDGYVKTGKKVNITGEDISDTLSFYLEPSTSVITGKVFLSKFPNPVTKEGIKVSAFDQTLNMTKNYVPVIEDFTDEDGLFELKGIIPGHKYSVSVIEAGKMTSTFTVTAVAGVNTVDDIVLIDLPPQIQVKIRKDPDSPRKVNITIKSPKELMEIPECKYNPGDKYDSTSAVSLALVPGPNHTFMGQFTTSVNSRYYTVKVTVGDIKKLEKIVVYDSISNSKTEQFCNDEILIGGNVYMDQEREEYSGLELDAGSLTQSSTETIDISDLVGGFFRSLPNVKTTKTSKGDLSISDSIKNIMASEIYEMDISNMQANKSFTLTLKYDKEKGINSDSLRIYQQDENGNWKEVPGTYSIDPMLGTVSVDIDSIEKAYEGTEGQNTPLGRKAHKMTAIVNGEYVPSATSTQQKGVFAVFTAKPDPNIAYSGSSYEIYNFPNPFNLKPKTISNIEGTGAFGGSVTYQTNGTIIKYHIPAGKGGHVKFVIYNTAGEKVRTLDEGIRAGGKTYYSEWDGKNDKNEDCASGVYFLMTYVNGEKLGNKPHKMAIVK